jgi:hypothetical protein
VLGQRIVGVDPEMPLRLSRPKAENLLTFNIDVDRMPEKVQSVFDLLRVS